MVLPVRDVILSLSRTAVGCSEEWLHMCRMISRNQGECALIILVSSQHSMPVQSRQARKALLASLRHGVQRGFFLSVPSGLVSAQIGLSKACDLTETQKAG